MVSIKAGVQIAGMKPEILLAIIIADSIYSARRIPCVLTSVEDSTLHKSTSLHYKGLAVDIRLPSYYTLSDQTAVENLDEIVTAAISRALGKEYDVVLEKDHIHVEYDPKTDTGGVT